MKFDEFWSSFDEGHLISSPQVTSYLPMSKSVTVESSDAPRKRCDFDKISPGWIQFTVTDWVVN